MDLGHPCWLSRQDRFESLSFSEPTPCPDCSEYLTFYPDLDTREELNWGMVIETTGGNRSNKPRHAMLWIKEV